MRVYNPYTHGYIEYPLNFDLNVLDYHIKHETPFTDRFSEWAVSILESGDMIYIPYGANKCTNIYVVTKPYINKLLSLPHGIYTISMDYFLGRC